MSFDQNLTLKNGLQANVTFIRLTDNDSKSLYSRSDRDVGEPVNLQIANTMAPAGYSGNDKFLVKVNAVKVDSTTGKLDTAVVNVTISASRRYTTTELLDLVEHAKSFLTEANLTKLRRGEV